MPGHAASGTGRDGVGFPQGGAARTAEARVDTPVKLPIKSTAGRGHPSAVFAFLPRPYLGRRSPEWRTKLDPGQRPSLPSLRLHGLLAFTPVPWSSGHSRR